MIHEMARTCLNLDINHFPNRWNSKYKYKIIIIGAQEETVNRSLTIFALLILQFFHQRKILPQRVPL